MTRRIALAVLLLLTGCAGSLEQARAPNKLYAAALPPVDPVRCAELDDQSRAYGFWSKSTAFVGGASGLSTVAVPDGKYSDEARVSLAIGAILLTGASVGTAFASDSATTSWARDCTR